MTEINPPQFVQLKDSSWQTVDGFDALDKDAPQWLTLDYKDETSVEQVLSQVDLSHTHKQSLLDPDVRPRLWITRENQVLLFIRGINLNPDSEPEDMVSVRIYFDGTKLICFRSRRLQSITEVRSSITSSNAESCDLQELFIKLLQSILLKIESQVTKLANRLDEIEDNIDEGKTIDIEFIEESRRSAAKLWRYLSPQQEVLRKLMNIKLSWLDQETQFQLQELDDDMTHEVEELALVKERCQLVENHESNKLSQRVNKNLYLISLITAVFIPVSFLTGLLGINVGGMPGVESNTAFTIVCVILLIIAAIEIIYLKWKKWF